MNNLLKHCRKFIYNQNINNIVFKQKALIDLENNELDKVPLVAKTPITPDLLFNEAGLIPGSIPISGVSNSLRKLVITFVVIVLQATIINLQFREINFLIIFVLLELIFESDKFP